MRKTIVDTATGAVVNVIEIADGSEWAAVDGEFIGPDGGSIGDVLIGQIYKSPDPLPDPPPTLDDYKAAVQAHIDATATSKNYADGVSLASYSSSTNPQWSGEASTFIQWRDQVWAYAYEQLALVQTGQRPQPTISELLSELPVITW